MPVGTMELRLLQHVDATGNEFTTRGVMEVSPPQPSVLPTHSPTATRLPGILLTDSSRFQEGVSEEALRAVFGFGGVATPPSPTGSNHHDL